ncbi:hypothetical protein [Myroides sp.]|uniref:hypothetical protein n=1 Tax=Myroides sp. TaxID=1874736 RepID=UPI003F2E13B6
MIRNKIIVLIAVLLCGVTWGQQARMFPYTLSLTGDSKPPQISEHFDKPELANSPQRYSKDGLALTYKEGDKTQEFSGIALDEIPFSSEFGFVVEFKYAMIDGVLFNKRYGDGMTMFIYDATQKFEVGAHGASLGYVYKNFKETNRNEPGLNGGYLGVGLDAYGDYRARTSSDWEKREGIVYDWKGNVEHVTVRGGQFGSDRYKGYPVLYTIKAKRDGNINRASLNYETGDYEFHDEQGTKSFDMYTGGYNYIVYNKVIVTVFPDNIKGGSYVEVQVDDGGNLGTVINRFFYPNEFKTRDQEGNLYTFKTKVPDQFKIGFSAGTGGAYQKHLVKDVKVSLPYEPEMVDVLRKVCLSSAKKDFKVDFEPYKDVEFYNGPVISPGSGNSKDYIDFESFRFEDEGGYEVGRRYEYDDPEVGKWKYDSNTGKVTLTISKDLKEGEYSVYYSAKGKEDGKWGKGPFGEDVYRSRPTKITIKVSECRVMFNPTIPVQIKVE